MSIRSSLSALTPSANHDRGELLMNVAEALHARELTARAVAKLLGEPAHRVRDAVAALTAEGLLAERRAGTALAPRYTLTTAGVQALSTRGRFPGDVVVLFTDLVASTELIAEHGEIGAHERRLRHLTLLRAAVQRTGGYEVKGLGDGIMVAFPDVPTAALCAAEMQAAVAADADGLGLRVGLHTGPVLRDADDLYGSTVIAAARLCNLAGAGETLCSAEIAAGLTPEARLVAHDAGLRELKGMPEPVETYRLTPAPVQEPRPVRRERSAGPTRPRRSSRTAVAA